MFYCTFRGNVFWWETTLIKTFFVYTENSTQYLQICLNLLKGQMRVKHRIIAVIKARVITQLLLCTLYWPSIKLPVCTKKYAKYQTINLKKKTIYLHFIQNTSRHFYIMLQCSLIAVCAVECTTLISRVNCGFSVFYSLWKLCRTKVATSRDTWGQTLLNSAGRQHQPVGNSKSSHNIDPSLNAIVKSNCVLHPLWIPYLVISCVMGRTLG